MTSRSVSSVFTGSPFAGARPQGPTPLCYRRVSRRRAGSLRPQCAAHLLARQAYGNLADEGSGRGLEWLRLCGFERPSAAGPPASVLAGTSTAKAMLVAGDLALSNLLHGLFPGDDLFLAPLDSRLGSWCLVGLPGPPSRPRSPAAARILLYRVLPRYACLSRLSGSALSCPAPLPASLFGLGLHRRTVRTVSPTAGVWIL